MNAFLIILLSGVIIMILEKLYPNKDLTKQNPKFNGWGWYARAIFFNFLQAFVIMLGYYTWEHLLIDRSSVFNLKQNRYLNPMLNGFIAYLINMIIFYWWHVLRHKNKFFWYFTHQFHHSPERIEVITAFYKHPFEIILNSVIISFLVYPVLGISIEGNSWLSIYSALGEYIYHMNIKTPYWLGYIIQRPESHIIHHERDKLNCYNYSDLPILDILGGTFKNAPKNKEYLSGFSKNAETKISAMLFFKDVIPRNAKKNMSIFDLFKNKNADIKMILLIILLLIGIMSPLGYILNSPTIKGLGFISTASPLPFVFSSYNSIETFSTEFNLDINMINGSKLNINMDNNLYQSLKGPYNRRNVYGVIFSHGPFFTDSKLIEIRQQILYWGLCSNSKGNGILAKEFGIYNPIKNVTINITSKMLTRKNKKWTMFTNCL